MIWLLTFAYAVLLALLSLLPSGAASPESDGGGGSWDLFIPPTVQNVMHVPAYAALGALVMLAVGKGRQGMTNDEIPAGGMTNDEIPNDEGMTKQRMTKGWTKGAALGIAAAILYGAAMEGLQAFVPGRTASGSDMLLNTAGVALGVGSVVWWRRKEMTNDEIPGGNDE